MAVTADSLLTPQGRLDRKVLWPRVKEDDVYEKLDGFLLDAMAKTAAVASDWPTLDLMVTRWAEWRAFDNVYQRLTVNPSSVDLAGQGSASWLVTQIENVKKLADEALAEFTELYDAALVSASVPVDTRSSYCAPTLFSP